jgi:hypothetical protein
MSAQAGTPAQFPPAGRPGNLIFSASQRDRFKYSELPTPIRHRLHVALGRERCAVQC